MCPVPVLASSDDKNAGREKLMGLCRALSRDENVYPDPYDFVPERFLGEKKQQDPREFAFGSGRRQVLPKPLLPLYSYLLYPSPSNLTLIPTTYPVIRC